MEDVGVYPLYRSGPLFTINTSYHVFLVADVGLHNFRLNAA
jgi:hypothetical protein